MGAPAQKLDWALWFASKGFLILQLQAGSKNPKRGFGWLKACSSDPEVIEKWFEEDPEMNYGVCPGPNHVILDLDNKPLTGKDGEAHLIGLSLEHEDIPETLTIVSPSGGKHKYFSTPITLSNAHGFGKESGIDIRGAHGYVVGPGCSLIKGKCKATDIPGDYYVDDQESEIDISPVPEWILDGYLKEKRDRDKQAEQPIIPFDLPENVTKAESFLKNRPPAIEGKGGNQWTYDTTTYLRDFGLSEDMALQVMFSSGWNEKCEPPWDWDELADVVEHAYRYGQNRPGAKADMLSMYDRMMNDIEAAEIDENDSDTERYGLDSHIFNPAEFSSRGKRREYVVPNWLPAHGFTALLAKRGMGKSTILLDLACRIACGLDWQGVPIKEDYVSIYLCGEDDEGLELNLVAWQKRNQDVPSDRMIIADVVTNLMDKQDVEQWAKKLHGMLAGRKAVVILDTWQRATSGAGQNKDEDMNRCVAHAEALARSLNGPLIGAFHPPKHNDNTIHGSAIIENASTAIWTLDKDPATGYRRLKVTRIKGPGEDQHRLFGFDTVPLEELDSFGNTQVGVLPVCRGGSAPNETSEAVERLKNARAAWAWLIRGVLEVDGRKTNPADVMKNRKQSTVAKELGRLVEDSEFMEEFGERATEMGLKAFGFTEVSKALSLHFKDNARPFLFEDDMIHLFLDKSGSKEFKTRRAEEGEVV